MEGHNFSGIAYRESRQHHSSQFRTIYSQDATQVASFLATIQVDEMIECSADTDAENRQKASYRYIVLVDGMPMEDVNAFEDPDQAPWFDVINGLVGTYTANKLAAHKAHHAVFNSPLTAMAGGKG